jgi:hypothetical protein
LTTSVNFTDTAVVGRCPQEQVITRQFLVTDGCGRSAIVTQIINVVVPPPLATPPPPVSIDCSASLDPASTGNPSVLTSCNATFTITYVDATQTGACSLDRNITRTFTVSDGCGNNVTVTQSITVQSTPPTIIAPPSIIILCDAETTPSVTGEPVANASCGGIPTVNFTDANVGTPVCSQIRNFTRTFTVVDSCGRQAQAVQTISVIAPPLTVTPPPPVSVTCENPSPSGLDGTPNVTAPCGITYNVTVQGGGNTSLCGPQSTFERTYTIVDSCGRIVQVQIVFVLGV